MKKSTRLLALLCAVAMMLALAACGSDTGAAGSTAGSAAAEGGDFTLNMYSGENAIPDLVTYETTVREIEDFNILHSQNATDFYVTANLVSGLCATNTAGEVTPAIASSWEANADSTEWTFHLRNDVTWVNNNGEFQANLTSADFVAGLEWVLNAAKNEAANTSMPIEMIKGAAEYYEYTSEMDPAEAEALTWNNEKFLEMVGIAAPDDFTVVYTMVAPKPYFVTVATYSCLYPASPAQLESMSAADFRGITYDTMWYCGPYTLTYYVYQNEKVFTANQSWFGNDEHTRFNTVTVKMVDSADTAFTLYQSGDIDNIELSESQLATITEGSEYYNLLTEKMPTKYSYQFHFCYNKNNEDGTPDTNWNTAVANEAFRLSWYYGLELTNYYKRTNPVNPLKCENDFYTMKGLVYTSDGKDYTDLVRANIGLGEYNGETMLRNNPELGAQYKQQAMEELSALGVTFPIEVDYYISASDQSALDTANVLADCFSNSLGDDYVKLNICTYASSLSQEVRTPKLASFFINGWGADYGDPQNYLAQECLGDDNAYYSAVYSCINDFVGEDAAEPYSEELIATYEEYTRLVKAADAIVDDLDARYTAYAEAEAYLLQHALVVPCNYNIRWQLSKINDYSKPNPMFGIVADHYYVDWETNSNGYTTADYDALAAK